MSSSNMGTTLFEHDEVTSKEILEDLLQSYRETERQIEEEMAQKL